MKSRILSDEFQVMSKIGKGAFSNVFKVRRIKDKKIYALKRVPIKNLKKKEMQNALNEIRILASIKHPFIVGFREAFVDTMSKDLCIIMEYVGGGDLQDMIKKALKKKRRISEGIIVTYFH